MPVLEEPAGEVEVAETPEKVVEQTPITEESVETLKSQLAKLNDELNSAKKGLSTAHQTISQRDAELKRKADTVSQIAEMREEMQLIAAAIASKQTDDGETPKVDILATLRAKQASQEAKRKADEAAAKLEDYRKRVEALGLEEDSPDYQFIYDNARFVDDPIKLAGAEKRLTKLEKERQKVATPQIDEDKEKEIQRRIEDGVREELKKRNLLKDETGSPAKSRGTPQEAMREYAMGRISEEEARRRGASFD